ncbi:MAG: energy transducer TonB [Caulobacterales bacterium]|nr:energy transducer TonB [Caulobacterales bacterium]
MTPALQKEIADAQAAADPSNGPPLADPLFKPAGAYSRSGPIGGYWPDRASRARQNGYAVLQCTSGPKGELNACKALAAVPGNWGFDEASLRMAKDRYMTIVPDPNRPPDEPVRVLIEFAK